MTGKVIVIDIKKIVEIKEKKEKEYKYTEYSFFSKIFRFLYFKLLDTIHLWRYGREFNEYGLTMLCGRQGSGKTVGMTEYLERMRKKYPDALIITNYGYIHETQAFTDWNDFFEVRNGLDGVIFAIDEIQNEFSSAAWKNFPESLLSEVTQQRKQRIKIVCTSQIFTRVVKPLREQCMEVIDCFTIAGRWTFMRAIDAVDYNAIVDNPEAKLRMRKLWRKSFIQDHNIRNLYDSYKKIEKISRTEFLSREERAS